MINAKARYTACRPTMLLVVEHPRRLDPGEIETLVALDVPARLATLDHDGFPHVTPLWFVWADGAFFMTSIADRPHVWRLSHNPRAGICIDIEDPERPDGQVRAIDNVELAPDHDAEWDDQDHREIRPRARLQRDDQLPRGRRSPGDLSTPDETRRRRERLTADRALVLLGERWAMTLNPDSSCRPKIVPCCYRGFENGPRRNRTSTIGVKSRLICRDLSVSFGSCF